jgi:hypothetical protein
MPPGAPPEPGTMPPVADELIPPELLAPELGPTVI